MKGHWQKATRTTLMAVLTLTCGLLAGSCSDDSEEWTGTDKNWTFHGVRIDSTNIWSSKFHYDATGRLQKIT